MALCATTALAGAVPWSCVCSARGRFGGVGAGAGCCVLPVSPCPPRVSCAVCGGPSCPGVPYPRSLVRHSMRSVRSAGSVRLPFWFPPRVLCVCVRSRSRGVRDPPPLPGWVWRATSRGPGAGRWQGRSTRSVPLRVSCLGPVLRLACLEEGGPVPFPPTWLGAARSPWGACGRGDPLPTPPRALFGAGPRAGLARCRGGTRAPGGGASCLGAGRPGSGALPPPTTRPFGRAAGGHYPLTRQQPHSARSCELALHALGAACGCPGGAPLVWVWGLRGWALSLSRPLVLSAVRPGPTTHWLWVRGVRAWGPVTNPTARTLACWLCALWGRHEGDRGGASCLGVGRPGSGALPTPTTRPFGRGAGAHYPLAVGAGVAGVGTRHQPHSALSCELALRAVGAA